MYNLIISCLIFFSLVDTTLQPRPVANRQYYGLPNNGAAIERRASALPASINVDPTRFHPHAKGKNIRLDGQFRRATRKNSFCNGITFSHRPVHLYEKVCSALPLSPGGYSKCWQEAASVSGLSVFSLIKWGKTTKFLAVLTVAGWFQVHF